MTEMNPMSHKVRLIYMTVFIVIFVAFIPFIVLYANGYRLNKNFSVVETGGIYVYTPQAGAAVSINTIFEGRTGNFRKELFTQNLAPGSYDVNVELADFIPWVKHVDVSAQEVTSLYPFLIPQTYFFIEISHEIEDAHGLVVKPVKANQDYINIMGLFKAPAVTAAPLQSSPVATFSQTSETSVMHKEDSNVLPIDAIQKDKTAIWKDGSRIIARWVSKENWMPQFFCLNSAGCKKQIDVIDAGTDIKTLFFYPGRDDVVIYATQTAVYVAEIDKRPLQINRKIYSGTEVDIRVTSNNDIFIRDGERLLKIEI